MRFARWLLLSTVTLLLACSHGARDTKTSMNNQSTQRITALTTEDQKRLQDQRAVVEKYLGDNAESRQKYQKVAGKLGLIQSILDANAMKADQRYELQCLGIVLGDALVQEWKMEWVMVEDNYGRDPAVRLPGTSMILYPLTMISKRAERGENVDVFDLFQGVSEKVDEMKRNGY